MESASQRKFGLLLLGALLTGSVALLAFQPAHPQSNPWNPPVLLASAVRGEILYIGCEDCHSVDENDVGPKHRGVVGRHAGIIADYNYSKALKNSGLIWDAATLDRWLTNPSALVPGTKMRYKVDDPQDRADIIAFLSQQK